MPRTKRAAKSTLNLIPKRPLADAINSTLEKRGLTQLEAAVIVRDAPSQLSLISTGKLDGFSPDRLLRILTKLGHDVDIRITKSRGSSGKVRLSVR